MKFHLHQGIETCLRRHQRHDVSNCRFRTHVDIHPTVFTLLVSRFTSVLVIIPVLSLSRPFLLSFAVPIILNIRFTYLAAFASRNPYRGMPDEFDVHSHLRMHSIVSRFQAIGLCGLIKDGRGKGLGESVTLRISIDQPRSRLPIGVEHIHRCLSCQGPYTILISCTTNSRPHSGGRSPFPTS